MTPTPARAPLRAYAIQIATPGEAVHIAALAPTMWAAWNQAFDHAQRLLGDAPPRRISVRPAPTGPRGAA